MKERSLLLLVILLIALPSCATEKYTWGNYETALYQYYKNPTDIEGFAEELAEVIEKGEPDDRVPPGIHAEYGYILFVQGKNKEANSHFEKERNKWPESTHLMDLMLESTKAKQEADTKANIQVEDMKGAQE